MKRIALAIAATLMAAPAVAQDFDWHAPENRRLVHQRLSEWADMCASIGFERLPTPDATTMQDRINAHLLLAASPEFVLNQWARLIQTATRDTSDLEERAADALIAARDDPSRWAEAENLYVNTLRNGFLNPVLAACREGTHDALISRNYYRGDGSVDRFVEQVRARFAESVRALDE